MKICIICQATADSKSSTPIKEDKVIRIIRAIKKKLNIAQMNELYVCKNDLQKHSERRKSFEKSVMFASILAGIILVVSVLSVVLSGKFELWGIISGIMLAGIIMLLPAFKYTPAIENKQTPKTKQKKRKG
ncbi:MAG: hypothetical protein ABID61_01315 [Candidatus Micrarchaeota archaeon]